MLSTPVDTGIRRRSVITPPTGFPVGQAETTEFVAKRLDRMSKDGFAWDRQDRSDRNLTPQAAEALEALITVAYNQLVNDQPE